MDVESGTAQTIASAEPFAHPDGARDWVPHVTAAYSNAEGPAQPVIEAAADAATTCDGTVGQVHLVTQERVGHSYRWERVATVHLGDGTRP